MKADTLVEAGPQGLAPIKNWRARPSLCTHARLPRRNTGITVCGCIAAMAGREKPPERCDCAAACNERMVIAVLNAIDCEPRQWMAAALTSTNSKSSTSPAGFRLEFPGARRRAAINGRSGLNIIAIHRRRWTR